MSNRTSKLDRGADVVIATPGRLLDHFERGKLLLNAIEILVVDEADRMLDMGFIPDIERICKKLPFTRQTLFFSATMPPEIQRLADNFLHNPERIEVSPPATAATTIVQRLKKAPDDPAGKRLALRELMQEVDVRNAIIFCNRKKDVGVVFRSLQRHGFNVGALHGDLDQRERTATLDAFRNGTIAFLAASDVAARGLDIPDVSHIFNYDVPVHPEDYVHRIGRTGRAGREGFAAMLVTPKDTKALKAIEKMLGQEIAWVDGPPTQEERAQAESSERSDGRRRRGGRSRRSKDAAPRIQARTQAPSTRAPEAPLPRRRAPMAPTSPWWRKPRLPSRKRPPPSPKSTEQDAGNGRQAKPREARARNDERRDGGRDRGKQGERKQGRGGQDRSQDRNKGSQQARGMGDHVPAFMMRPVRVP